MTTAAESVFGPEDPDTGDSMWIEPPIAETGAQNGDRWYLNGAWRTRITPDPPPASRYQLCRAGMRTSYSRVWQSLAISSTERGADGTLVEDDAVVKAMMASYELLEWIHSMNELLRSTRLSDVQRAEAERPDLAGYVLGSLGARNAFHHGHQSVLGTVEPPDATMYTMVDRRWVLVLNPPTEIPPVKGSPQVRWVDQLAPDPKANKPAVQAFHDHLAGREVRNSLGRVTAFFLYLIEQQPIPSGWLLSTASVPPPRSTIGLKVAHPQLAEDVKSAPRPGSSRARYEAFRDPSGVAGRQEVTARPPAGPSAPSPNRDESG